MSEIVGDYSTTEDKIHKPNRERNVSGELDVFEATRYFSDFNEPTRTDYSRTQIQKQSIVTEHRQNRVHPQTGDQLPEPKVVLVKPQEITHGGGGKLTSFFNSLLRTAGLKKSKSKSTLEVVETPRGERRRRQSCMVTAHAEATSLISGARVSRLNAPRRSFDEKHVKDSKKSDQNLNLWFCENLCSNKRVQCEDRNAGDKDVNGGCDSDSSSESDLFELDLFTN